MADYVSNPLLSLIKEQGLIDDLQLDEVLAEQNRSGKNISQVLHDLGAQMVGDDLQLRFQFHDAEVLQNLRERFAAAVLLLQHLVELQVVD